MNRRNVLTCVILSCTHAVTPGQLMCPAHWRRVPADVQREVYSAHRALRSATPRTIRRASEHYRSIREKAAKAVLP